MSDAGKRCQIFFLTDKTEELSVLTVSNSLSLDSLQSVFCSNESTSTTFDIVTEDVHTAKIQLSVLFLLHLLPALGTIDPL